MLTKASKLLCFGTMVPRSSHVVIMSSYSIFKMTRLLLAGTNSTAAVRGTTATTELVIVFLVFSLFIFVLFFFSTPSRIAVFNENRVNALFGCQRGIFDENVVRFVACLFR